MSRAISAARARVLLDRQQIDQQRAPRARARCPARGVSIHSGRSGGRSTDAIRSARPPTPSSALRYASETIRRVVVGDEQLLHRRPERLELAGLAEVGFAEHGARERHHAALAVLVGRDRVEDRRQPIGRLTVEGQRRRQQLRHLHIVERGAHGGDDRHGLAVVLATGAPASRRADRAARRRSRGCR